MLHFASILATGITIKISASIWSISLSIILSLIIAIIIGLIAKLIVRDRIPIGFIGSTIAAFIGIWLMTQIIIIQGIGDIFIFGIPIIRALIGAIILVILWGIMSIIIARWRNYGIPRPA
jgi:uncharacterized membrane protein YeaQ/YmgE (transglycosylase-associated protein family)